METTISDSDNPNVAEADTIISDYDRQIIAKLKIGQSSKFKHLTWRNLYLAAGLLLLLTLWLGVSLQLLNADYTLLEDRTDRAVTAIGNLVEEAAHIAKGAFTSLQKVFAGLFVAPKSVSVEGSYIAPLPNAQWQVLDETGMVINTWEMPEYTKEVMANPALHVPAQEEVSRFNEEGITFPDYVQKEYVMPETWLINSQEIRDSVWVDILNTSHTDIADNGEPVMHVFAEWQIGVWNTPYEFKLNASDRDGYSLLTWEDDDGINFVEYLPIGSFIKIGYGTGAVYLYQEADGMIKFTQPLGEPIFQVAFYMLPQSMETIIVDSGQPVPYGLMKPIPGSFNSMLHRKWTQPLECPVFLSESTICNSLLQ